MQAGENFDMTKNTNILKINSPKNRVSGPFVLVYKNIKSRWALVAFSWDKKPQLGLRWFWDNAGMPISRGHSTWLVVPQELTTTILNGLPLNAAFRAKIDDFLSGKISGLELKGMS